MPDGSYRKTYATTSKTYLDCLEMDVLSETFDAIDVAMMNVLNKFRISNISVPVKKYDVTAYLKK